MTLRLAIVAALVVVMLAGRLAHARRRARLAGDTGPVPAVPSRLLGPGERTWVVFTSPLCALCGPVTERLRAADPDGTVVTVDATREPELARSFRVRSAPTVLLADRSGTVARRWVGADALGAAEVAGVR
jgi:hypothetical protein